MNSLEEQVALVTGGGRGIGRVIALELAAAGARVAVSARSVDQIKETVDLIQQQGGRGLAVAMDVTEQADVAKAVAIVEAALGPIDLLVNNAGITGMGNPDWEMAAADWWRVLEVNLQGPFLCSQAVLPGMIARRRGRIINMSSNAALAPFGPNSAYSVSKAALLRLTDSMAAATQAHNVAIFAISPGLVHTDMTADVPFFQDLPASAWTPPERAAELCRFLATGAADKLSGRYIHVSEDIHVLVARADEIIENDLYAMRLKK